MTLNLILRFCALTCVGANACLTICPAQSRTAPASVRLRHFGQDPATDSRMMRGPVLGLVANETNTELQEILGIPGSAVVGNALALPEAVERIYLAPAQRWSLVIKANGAGLAALGFDRSPALSLSEIDSSMPSPDLVSFSPSGARAITYSRTENRIQVISYLNSVARVERNLAIPEFAGAVRLIALDDAAETPVIVTDSGRTYVLRNDLTIDLALPGQGITDLAFLPAGKVLFAVDNSGSVTAVEGLFTAPQPRTIARDLGASGNRYSVQGLRDSHSLLIASTNSNIAWRLNVDTSEVEQVSLPEVPARLERLRNGDQFLFSYRQDAPVWVLLADEPVMRAVFAARPSAEPSTNSVHGRNH